MVSTHGQKEISLTRVFCVVFIGLLISCSSPVKTDTVIYPSVDLKAGDIVVRKGNGYFSNFFKELGSRDKKYSHIGLIERVRDSVYVIHIEASELTGQGIVMKEPIGLFLNEISEYAFYSNTLDSISRQAILTQAKEYYKHQVSFDLEFDAANDDKLYCSELVAASINKGMGKQLIMPTLIYKNIQFYGLDDIYKASIFKKIE